MGACIALFRRNKEEDVESSNALLKTRNSVELELGDIKQDSKPKHKNSDFDELLLEMCDNGQSADILSLSAQMELDDDRRIKFSHVEVRQYKRCMDYHPCVSSGVPLGLDWEFDADEVLSLDEYESSRGSERVERQSYACVGRLDPR
jgi:hypothetical protein